MKSSLRLTIALGAGLIALPAIAAQMPKTASLTHEAAVIAVRGAMARAAKVSPDRIQVSANEPGPGVDLSNGLPDLTESPHKHH